MCRAMEDMRNQSWNEGRESGRQENRKETALRMLRAGRFLLEEVAEISGLSLDEVKQLQANT